MAYFVVEQFASGLDLRRAEDTAPAGTLRRAKNVHITPGGEIEKRTAMPLIGTVPGTVGLAGLGTKLYAFEGYEAGSPPATPVPVIPFSAVGTEPMELTVQRLEVPVGRTLQEIVDVDIFDGKLFVVARMDNGTIRRYFDGVYQATALGLYCRTYQSKLYTVGGKLLNGSAVLDATKWPGDVGATGAFSTNLATHDAESEDLVGIEIYYDQLAIMSRRTTQLWAVDPDPLQNSQLQVLRGAGLVAPASIKGYGSGDVLYLTDTGIRSLRAKDSSNAAAVSDVGSPIDPLIRDMFIQQGFDFMSKAKSVIEPITGRFWCCFPDRILVLSYFPGPKVTAWSEYRPQFLNIDAVAQVGGYVALRNGDSVYLYNGLDPTGYDANAPTEVRLPFLDMGEPATVKRLTGLDCALRGTWRVAAAFDPQKPEVEETLATLTNSTFSLQKIPMQARTSHVSLRFYNQDNAAAAIGNVIIHFDKVKRE